MCQIPVLERRRLQRHVVVDSVDDVSTVSCHHGQTGRHVQRYVTLTSRGLPDSVTSYVTRSRVAADVLDDFTVAADVSRRNTVVRTPDRSSH